MTMYCTKCVQRVRRKALVPVGKDVLQEPRSPYCVQLCPTRHVFYLNPMQVPTGVYRYVPPLIRPSRKAWRRGAYVGHATHPCSMLLSCAPGLLRGSSVAEMSYFLRLVRRTETRSRRQKHKEQQPQPHPWQHCVARPNRGNDQAEHSTRRSTQASSRNPSPMSTMLPTAIQ